MSKNVFSEVMQNKYDRHFGGTTVGVADPYVSGYHFIEWMKLPTEISKYIGKGGETQSPNDIEAFLAGSCISVTPPGGTIEKTEFTALGGIKYAVPTSVTYANNITLKFLEYSHLPVLNIIHAWCRMIRDYRTGTSHLGSTDVEYSKSNYAATLLYWTTRPDGKTVEYSACYTGLFPLKDPQDAFTGDFTAIDKVEIDIEFNVDYMHHEDWVFQKAQELSTQRSTNVNFKPNLRNELTGV